jgi:hypothetical protein
VADSYAGAPRTHTVVAIQYLRALAVAAADYRPPN